MSAETAPEDAYASPVVESTDYPPQTDPTLAHAALTELDAVPLTSLANGHDESTAEPPSSIPQNSGIDEGAANAAAESNWDTNADLSTSQEWVDVSRDAAETETRTSATIAAPSNTQSWADDRPESPKAEVSPLLLYLWKETCRDRKRDSI
jgi:hypothetical protein